MKKIKVVHLSSVHKAFDTRIFHKECKSLVDAGYDISLVVPHSQDEIVDSVKILAVPIRNNRISRMLISSISVFSRGIKEDADIYHFHDSELLPIGLLFKLLGKKVVYDVHEDLPRQLVVKKWLPPIFRIPIAKSAEVIEWVASHTYLDGVVTVTDRISSRFPKNKTVLVQNFPIINELSSLDKYDCKSRKRNICFVGSIKANYGIKEMVQALGLLKGEIRLLLGGRFQYESYKTELEQLDGWQYVEYLGWVDRTQYKKILSKSIAGLVVCLPEPNIIEAQPNKLFEYMSASIPVIASDFPRWRKIIDDAKCGYLVNPTNPEDIAKAIRKVVDDLASSEEMGRLGRLAIEEKFNWNNESKTLLKFYSRLLG